MKFPTHRFCVNMTEEQKDKLDFIFADAYGQKTKMILKLLDMLIKLAEGDPKRFIIGMLSGDVELRYKPHKIGGDLG